MRLLSRLVGMQVRVLLAELKKGSTDSIMCCLFYCPLPIIFESIDLMETSESRGPCSLYILYSEEADRYYAGISRDPYRRLVFHNSMERGFTSRYRPWKLLYVKEYPSRIEAQRAEKKVKSWKSRKMTEKVIKGELSV